MTYTPFPISAAWRGIDKNSNKARIINISLEFFITRISLVWMNSQLIEEFPYKNFYFGIWLLIQTH